MMKSVKDHTAAIIIDFCNTYGISISEDCTSLNGFDGNITINDDGTIDAKNCRVNHLNITEIPFNLNVIDGVCSFYGTPIKTLKSGPRAVGSLDISCNNNIRSLDYFPDLVLCNFSCMCCPNIPRSELYKIVGRVLGNIYTTSDYAEDKDQLRRERDKYLLLQHSELGNLDL